MAGIQCKTCTAKSAEDLEMGLSQLWMWLKSTLMQLLGACHNLVAGGALLGTMLETSSSLSPSAGKHAINSGTPDRSLLGVIFRELKYLLCFGFIKWNDYHCPRACNVPAHELAALGCSGAYGNQCVWLSNLPDNVMCVVTTDLVGPG